MANGQRRTDKQLKTPAAVTKAARKTAGPKYLRSSLAPSPTVLKTTGSRRAS